MAEIDVQALLADAREVYAVFGKSQKALEIVEQVLAVEGTNLEALNLKAAILYDLDRDEEAAAFHQRALVLEPHSVEALHGMASIANDTARYQDAIDWTERGFAAFPHDPHPELVDNEDLRQRLLAELFNEQAFAYWYLGQRDVAMRLLTEDGPALCPLEIENFEDELAWLEEHPDTPDE